MREGPAKLLIATPDFPLWDGGISTVAFEVAKGFARRGHHVGVMAPRQQPGDREFDRTLPFKVFRVRNLKDKYLKMAYHTIVMDRIVRQHDFGYVMAQSWYPSGIAAAFVSSRRTVGMSLTVHGNEILNKKFSAPFWKKRMRRVFEQADCIFCVSDDIARKTREVFPDLRGLDRKTTVIFNGVDSGIFTPNPPKTGLVEQYGLKGKRVILTLARLVERKGQDMVIRALPEIRQRVGDVVYLVCGKGSHESELRRLAEECGVSEHVIFAGFVANEERVDYYNLCDIYAMPSREIPEKGDVEGFGITYLEANACGKPVIGGKSGGVFDAVVDGATGLLVDPEDIISVAEACVLLLTDGELARTLGTKGRERVVKSFNWDAICSRMEQKILADMSCC
jgi:phosphatidylinositol alpha-1,6-mannosyltransferase